MRVKCPQLVGRSIVVALCATSWPVLAGEPAECSRARQLQAAGKQQQAALMQRQCAQKSRAQGPAPSAPARAPAAPAPAPFAARPAASQSSASSEAPANWALGLPTPAQIRAAINGSSPADSALRQRAAFTILRQLITELSGFGEWPPAAVSKMREYDKASPDPPTLGPANPYVMNLDFQREVLAKLVAPPVAKAYESSSWFRDLEAPTLKRQQQAEQARRDAEQARRDAAAASAAAKAADAAIPGWVKSNVAKAQAEHVNLSFFGLQLGQALNLPQCGDETGRILGSALGTLGLGAGNTPRGGPQTCVGDIMGENMNQHSLAGAIAGLARSAATKSACRAGNKWAWESRTTNAPVGSGVAP